MARERTSRYAVLGMLTQGPRSGYDIKREIGSSVRHFWSESYGQVYPVLRELVRDGLATVEVEPGEGRPQRKVYALTDVGLEELRRWLAKPVVPQPSRNELLLKLFFGRYLPDAQLVELVRDARDRWVADLAEWATAADRIRANPSLSDLDARDRLFTLEYGRIIGEATVQWADAVLATLQGSPGEQASPTPTNDPPS